MRRVQIPAADELNIRGGDVLVDNMKDGVPKGRKGKGFKD